MLNLLHRGICVILLFLMQQTLRNTVEGWKTKGCENPGEIKRGYRVGTNFSSGATVEYFCDPGFRLVSGSRLRTCENGKWSGTSPRCRGRNKLSAYACGTIVSRNTSRVRRIVGGKISKHGAWPWQAAIYYENGAKSFLFNGALIKPGWVLTIANALRRDGRPIKLHKLKVVLGEFNRNKVDGTEKFRRIRRVVVHPGYSRSNLSNNIALLQLEKPVKPNKYIRMVCIPRRKRDSRLEKPPNYGTVAGWGTTKKIRIGQATGPLSVELQQVTIPIVPNKECKRASIYRYDSSLNFCAGYRKKPKDPCFADIGSPLVMQNPRTGRWVVVGLFGWSEGCAQPRKYSYYTRVSKYSRWILSVIRRRH
ncbi:transmembrane protease serine 6-like [Actinia tenebrosa]|uniref:Transmembrane protease serine 6-like n=1 Tax=Actinia tenebrosa TaxID=6105 RepID=A0A6P8H191_ACTTE|nr:transmembrane protease serine 6-like [Actinia tenebrosa]